jgi:hypothetical protein
MLSLTGVLLGGVGAFVLATIYDRENPVERKVGLAVGVVMTVLGVVLFTVGWFV